MSRWQSQKLHFLLGTSHLTCLGQAVFDSPATRERKHCMDTMPQFTYRSLPGAMALQNIDGGLRPLNHSPRIPSRFFGARVTSASWVTKNRAGKRLWFAKMMLSSQCYMPCVYNASIVSSVSERLPETLRLGFGEASMISVGCSKHPEPFE